MVSLKIRRQSSLVQYVQHDRVMETRTLPLLFIVQCITILLCGHFSCADHAGVNDIGPYDDIYPSIDITHDQQTCSVIVNGTCPLYIALMVSFGGEYNGRGNIAGVQMALDEINRDTTMLPGYTLHYTLKKTVCETHGTVALDALHTELLQPPTKVGVIGSGCSLATEPTAQVSHYYNLTHLSCVSSSSSLADRSRFRFYFQLLATEADLAFGFYSIIAKFRWRRVAILLQEESLFEVTMNRLVHLLTNINVKTKVQRFSSADSIAGLGDQPFDDDYRIYVFAMFQSHARRLLCEASQRGVHYPRYQFLMYGWYDDQWWIGKEEVQDSLQRLYNNNCSALQREQVIGPAMSPLQDEFISNCSKAVESGINGFEFQRKYEDILNQSMSGRLDINVPTIYAQQCYDATWTLARALNSTNNEVNKNPNLRDKLKEYEANLDLPADVEFGLQHFSYNNSGVVNLVYDELNRTNFTGITGDIFFNTSNGVRIVPKTVIFQYRPTNVPECSICSCSKTPQKNLTIGRRTIAEVNIDNLDFNLLIDENLLWTDGVPFDGVPIPVTVTVHLALIVICSLLATAGIVFSIFCMIFNFVYRERKLIRLTSPNLNYLIGAGAIVLYIDVYFYVMPASDQVTATVFCNLTPWLTALGYSLCYGTIVAKMFRVFYIFRNPTAKKRTVQDWMLGLMVVIFIAIDVVILLLYTIVEGAQGNLDAELRPNDELIRTEVGPTGIVMEYFFYVCDSKNRDIALGILYGYKAVLQIVALVFSFSIRKVRVKGLNDAKYIAAAVYVTSIVTAVIIVSLYSLKTFLNLYAALFGLGFFIGTTVILVLVFIPKMISLHRDPEGENVFSKTALSSLSHASPNHSRNKEALKENEQLIESLRNRVKELESSLQQDETLDSSGDHSSDRKMSTSKVTFSEVNTLILKNGQSSVNGSMNNIVDKNP